MSCWLENHNSVRSVIESFRPVLWTGSLTIQKERFVYTSQYASESDVIKAVATCLHCFTQWMASPLHSKPFIISVRNERVIIHNVLRLNIKLQFHLFKSCRAQMLVAVEILLQMLLAFEKGSNKIEYIYVCLCCEVCIFGVRW